MADENQTSDQGATKSAAKSRPQKTKEPSQKTAVDAFEIVRLRNFFYRDNYRRLVILSLFLGFIIFFLAAIVYYLHSHRPEPKYFATNIKGQIIPLEPLSKASMSEADLLGWSQRAVAAALTINYVEYRQQLQNAIDTYFTPSAGDDYLASLTASQFLGTVQANYYIVTATASQAPVINREGIWAAVGNSLDKYKGLYYWELKMPVTRTYHAANRPDINEKLDVQMLVVRSSALVDNTAKNLDAVRGVGIAQIVIKTLSQNFS